jgi:hypothetical protein
METRGGLIFFLSALQPLNSQAAGMLAPTIVAICSTSFRALCAKSLITKLAAFHFLLGFVGN